MITPVEHYPELAKIIGLNDLYFKREDLHPYGSHKGRSIPYMIDHYYEKGDRKFAISSSGNAALAAILHIKKLNSNNTEPIELTVFVGNYIAPYKLNKLKDTIKDIENETIRILIKERPLQALAQAIEDGYRSLRQSTDDEALVGYQSLVEEITSMKNVGAVVIGTSSGTTAHALADSFFRNKIPIQVHIVQTTSCHIIADAFETFDGTNEKSIADAIVDKIAHRKTKLVSLINKIFGYGWVATNDEIVSAQELVQTYTGLSISTNSALSVVGAMQIAERGWEIKGAVVCMICGD